jgi:nicotinamide-nucleotide amidase
MQTLRELLLQDPRLSLSVAESLTCGRIQARLGAHSGASDFFLGGITAYSLDQKIRHLGCDEATTRALNGVSKDVAEQMAIGCSQLFNSDIALATTGYAEPCPERGAPHPFYWWAVAQDLHDGRHAVCSGMIEMPGCSREKAQELATTTALNSLLRFLSLLRTS